MRRGRTPDRERVLVVVRGHLGDMVQALPALRDLRKARPSAHIAVLLNEYVKGALEGCPYVDEVMPGFAYRRRNLLGDAIHVPKLCLSVAGRFDTVIGLRWSPTVTPILSILTGASVRVGYDRTGRLGRLLTHDLGREPIDTVSNRVLNQLPLSALGIHADPTYPTLDWLPERVSRETCDLLESNGVPEGADFCAVQLSSHWGCGEWSSTKWARLTDYLVDRGLKVVVTGTSEWFERAKLESVRRRCRAQLVSILGMTSIAHLFEVVRRARLVVAGDSGLAQIALAQRTPSVVLFGIEEIEANGPLPGEESILMRTIQHWDASGRSSSPNPHCQFGQSHCHGRFCSEDSSRRHISASDVTRLVDDVLRARISDYVTQ